MRNLPVKSSLEDINNNNNALPEKDKKKPTPSTRPTGSIDTEDTRISMQDFDRGDGHRRKELYNALAKPPVDHPLGKAAARVPHAGPVLRTLVEIPDFYFETLSGVKASIPPLPWIAGFFFGGIFINFAASLGGPQGMWYANSVLIALASYVLGVGTHITFSRLYLYFRGEREADFPDDFLAELDRDNRLDAYAPRLDHALRRPQTPEEFKAFFKYYSEFLTWLIQEKHFDAVAKVLRSIRMRFPYMPVHELIDKEIELPLAEREDLTDLPPLKSEESAPEKMVEILKPEMDPRYKQVQRIIALQKAQQYSVTGKKQVNYQPSAGGNWLLTEHREPLPRPPRQREDMEPVVEAQAAPQRPQEAQREFVQVDRCDIYSLPLFEGGEVELSHMPDQKINLPPYMRPTALLSEVDAPELNENNIAIHLAEFVGRKIRHAPLHLRENYSETGLYQLCCAGNCCCERKSEALRDTLHLQLLKAMLKDDPFSEPAPVRQVNPALIRVVNLLQKTSTFSAPTAEVPKLENTSVQDDDGPDNLGLGEGTPLLRRGKAAQVFEDLPFETKEHQYRFQGEHSDLHRRALEILGIMCPPTGKHRTNFHDWSHFRNYAGQNKKAFFIFMSLSEEEKCRLIYILLSGYSNSQLLCISLIENQYIGRKSINPLTCFSEEGILQKSYDGKQFTDFLRSYIKNFKKAGGDERVLTQHIYLLTSISNKRSIKHTRALFEHAPKLAAQILVILTNPAEYSTLYAAHINVLFYQNGVSPAAQDAIWAVLRKQDQRDCLSKLRFFLEEDVKKLNASGLRFAELPRIAFSIKDENPDVRKKAYAVHAQKISGLAWLESVEYLASLFKRRNSLRSFCDKGKLVELRDTFREKLTKDQYDQAIARVAFALLKKERRRREIGPPKDVKMRKAQLLIFICEHLFAKNNDPASDFIQIFFDIGIQLKIDGEWERSEKEFQEIFEYCLYPKRLIRNENLSTSVLLQGLIAQYGIYESLKRQYAAERADEDSVNVRQVYMKFQQSILYKLLHTLVSNSLSKKGKDRLGLITALEQVEFPQGLLIGLLRAVCELEAPKKIKYQYINQMIDAFCKDEGYLKIPLSNRMDFSLKLLGPRKTDLSFGEMWLFLAWTQLNLLDGQKSIGIVKEMLGKYSAQMPDNAVQYLMPIFCAYPTTCCEVSQRTLLLQHLFSTEKINYKLYAKGFAKVMEAFKDGDNFLPALLLPDKPKVEEKRLACRCTAMMLYSLYDELFWGPQLQGRGLFRYKKIPQDKEATKNAKQMWEIMDKLRGVLGDSRFIEDFVCEIFKEGAMFKILFVEMGFRKRDADNIAQLILRYNQMLTDESIKILNTEDITLEEDDFFQAEPSAEDLFIDAIDLSEETGLDDDAPVSQDPAEDDKGKEEAAPGIAPGSASPAGLFPSLGAAPAGYQQLRTGDNEVFSDQEEESTSYDEEEESSLSSGR